MPVGLDAELARGELGRRMLHSEGRIPEWRMFLAKVIINACLCSPLASEHAEHST